MPSLKERMAGGLGYQEHKEQMFSWQDVQPTHRMAVALPWEEVGGDHQSQSCRVGVGLFPPP